MTSSENPYLLQSPIDAILYASQGARIIMGVWDTWRLAKFHAAEFFEQHEAKLRGSNAILKLPQDQAPRAQWDTSLGFLMWRGDLKNPELERFLHSIEFDFAMQSAIHQAPSSLVHRLGRGSYSRKRYAI